MSFDRLQVSSPPPTKRNNVLLNSLELVISVESVVNVVIAVTGAENAIKTDRKWLKKEKGLPSFLYHRLSVFFL